MVGMWGHLYPIIGEEHQYVRNVRHLHPIETKRVNSWKMKGKAIAKSRH